MADAGCARALGAILATESVLAALVRQAMKVYLDTARHQVLPPDGSVQPNRLPGDEVWRQAAATWVLPAVAAAWSRRFAGCSTTAAPGAERSYLAAASDRILDSRWVDAVDTAVIEAVYAADTRDAAHETVDKLLDVGHWVGWATTISRTEGLAVVNAATFAAARATASGSAVLAKEWVSMRDDLVRHTHQVADGQRVGLDEDFQVGGHRGAYPGDPRLPVGEAVNCRCVLRITTV